MKEKEEVNTRISTYTHTQERRHLPFSNSISTKRKRETERQREQFTQSFIKQRRRKKSGYFDKKNLVELQKKKEKREISFFSICIFD